MKLNIVTQLKWSDKMVDTRPCEVIKYLDREHQIELNHKQTQMEMDWTSIIKKHRTNITRKQQGGNHWEREDNEKHPLLSKIK